MLLYFSLTLCLFLYDFLLPPSLSLYACLSPSPLSPSLSHTLSLCVSLYLSVSPSLYVCLLVSISPTFYTYSFYVRRSRKCKKIQLSHWYLFTLSGSASVKAVRSMFMKLSPYICLSLSLSRTIVLLSFSVSSSDVQTYI